MQFNLTFHIPRATFMLFRNRWTFVASFSFIVFNLLLWYTVIGHFFRHALPFSISLYQNVGHLLRFCFKQQTRTLMLMTTFIDLQNQADRFLIKSIIPLYKVLHFLSLTHKTLYSKVKNYTLSCERCLTCFPSPNTSSLLDTPNVEIDKIAVYCIFMLLCFVVFCSIKQVFVDKHLFIG